MSSDSKVKMVVGAVTTITTISKVFMKILHHTIILLPRNMQRFTPITMIIKITKEMTNKPNLVSHPHHPHLYPSPHTLIQQLTNIMIIMIMIRIRN